MGVPMQHKRGGSSVLLGVQGHIETQHNGAQLIPEVCFILEQKENQERELHALGYMYALTTPGWQEQAVNPSPAQWLLDVPGGRQRQSGIWSCLSCPGPG